MRVLLSNSQYITRIPIMGLDAPYEQRGLFICFRVITTRATVLRQCILTLDEWLIQDRPVNEVSLKTGPRRSLRATDITKMQGTQAERWTLESSIKLGLELINSSETRKASISINQAINSHINRCNGRFPLARRNEEGEEC
jgi:hypothetical protein